jgi:hypothetical protein
MGIIKTVRFIIKEHESVHVGGFTIRRGSLRDAVCPLMLALAAID